MFKGIPSLSGNVNKDLLWHEMWRALRKEEVADLPHHAQHRFEDVSLGTSEGHIRVADWQDFRREYRHLRRYVEDWMEESEAARVYDMLPYKWQEKVQAEEQKRGRWRTVIKILLPRQQHQCLLQWINSWATAHYGFDTMKNALMLTTEDSWKGDSLRAMDTVKSTTGMQQVGAMDPPMTADEIIHLISERMTLQHHNEAQRQEPGDNETGSRGMLGRQMRTSPNLPPLSGGTSQRAVAVHSMPVEANLRVCCLRLVPRRWTPSWRNCTGCSPPARRMQPASGKSRAAGILPRCHSASTARVMADQMARAAAMSLTGRYVITAMIRRAAR